MPTLHLLAIILLSASLIPSEAQACSCTEASVEARFEHSSAVFEGRLIRMEQMSDARRLVFHVTRAWKGVNEEHLHVQTPLVGALCGYEGFQVSQHYIVFARRNADGTLVTGLCDGNAQADEALETLAQLGAGVTPITLSPDDAEDPGPSPITARPPAVRAGCQSCTIGTSGPAKAPVGLLCLGAAWILTMRRRRRNNRASN